MGRSTKKALSLIQFRVDCWGERVLVPAMQESDQETGVVNEEVVPEQAVNEGEASEAVELEGNPKEDESDSEEPKEALSPEEEAAKWREAAIRTAADLDNYRKRMARERADDLRYAKGGLIEELLPVFDNFLMGLQMAEQEQDSMIYKGMAMVKGQLDDFLSAQGVKEVNSQGVFDPNYHEAVAEEFQQGAEPGEILFVKRKGYMLHDRLLRAAAVIVAKSADEEPSEPQEEE